MACDTNSGNCIANFGVLIATPNNVCRSGVCSSDSYAACTCSTVGDLACAAGAVCCGSSGCVNLLDDEDNCGGCGVRCPHASTPTYDTCLEGRCCPASGCPEQAACVVCETCYSGGEMCMD
jgi:hypothetical protein